MSLPVPKMQIKLKRDNYFSLISIAVKSGLLAIFNTSKTVKQLKYLLCDYWKYKMMQC